MAQMDLVLYWTCSSPCHPPPIGAHPRPMPHASQLPYLPFNQALPWLSPALHLCIRPDENRAPDGGGGGEKKGAAAFLGAEQSKQHVKRNTS